MYRHLFLDLDGTLMDFREAERRAFTLMAGQLEIPIDEDSHLLFARGNRACWKEHEEGRLSIEELSLKRFILFGESGGLSFTDRTIIKMIRAKTGDFRDVQVVRAWAQAVCRKFMAA